MATAIATAIAIQACAGGRAREHDIISFSNISTAWESSRGAGVTLAIVDWQFDLGWRARGKYVDAVSVVPGEEIGAMKAWHGEWMAEIVHAVAPDARVIPINARTLKDRDYQKYLVQGIRYAADRGAIAVASSMGPTVQSDEFRAAIDYAWVRGTTFVDVLAANGKSPNRALSTNVGGAESARGFSQRPHGDAGLNRISRFRC